MCAQHRLFSRICGLMAIANAVWGAPQDLSNDLTHRPVLLSNPSAPTKVFSAVVVNGYGMLDTASSTISIDFYLYMNWRDDRLANRTLTNGFLSDADIQGQKVWWPRTEVYACVTVTECACHRVERCSCFDVCVLLLVRYVVGGRRRLGGIH